MVRVTWMSVVSNVAMVDSTTARTMILPPLPCQTCWPRTFKTSAELPLICPEVSTMFVAIVNTSNSTNTTRMPMIAPRPGVFFAPLVSSFRFAVTSHPQ